MSLFGDLMGGAIGVHIPSGIVKDTDGTLTADL
jgi:hypothetical protein